MECNIDELDIYYEEIGKGKPILMVHGFYSDHQVLKGCFEPIFDKEDINYKRIYLDLPGMGKTDSSESISDQNDILEILLKFINNVIGEESFLLVGKSQGGYLARGILKEKQSQIDGVCLITPTIITDKSKRTLPQHLSLNTDQQFINSLTPSESKHFKKIAVVQNERTWKRYKEEIYSGIQKTDAEFLNKIVKDGFTLNSDIDDLPKPFNKPSLILAGKQDSFVGYQDAWNLLENFERTSFVVLDKAGHNLQIEQESLFNCLVENWLRRV